MKKRCEGLQVHMNPVIMNSVIACSIFFFGIDRSTRVGKVSKRQEKVVVAETTAT